MRLQHVKAKYLFISISTIYLETIQLPNFTFSRKESLYGKNQY